MSTINFKFLWSIIGSLILLALMYYLINPFANRSDLDKLHYIGASAGRIMDRHMQFYENYDSAASWERALHDFLFGSQSYVEDEAIKAYREVLNHMGEAHDEMEHAARINIITRLLVILAERRSTTDLQQTLALLSSDPEEAVIAKAIRYAYFEQPEQFTPEVYTGANLLPLGWAQDRLNLRIAQKTGDVRSAYAITKYLQQRGQEHRRNVRLLILAVMIIISLGLYTMFRHEVLYQPSPWNKGVLHAPWPFFDGLVILITAAIAGLVLSLLLNFLPRNLYFTPGILTSWSTLFASLPMLWLIHHYLLKPRGLNFRSAFGLRLPEAGGQHFFTTTFALMALNWIGVLLIGWGTWQLGLGSHWTAGMQERLVFGPSQTVWLSSINIVLWSPIFEEIGFRGLLYPSLRHRLPATTAIVISALLFASLHLYSIAGFLSVFWSGLILAYAFERYHSLLPGIMIHAAANLFSIGPVLLFYR